MKSTLSMKKKAFTSIIALHLLFCTSTTIFAMDVYELTRIGSELKAEEVTSLENELVDDPQDLDSRTKLLGYYFCKQFESSSVRKAKQKHIIWLIENSPKAEVLGKPEGSFHASLDSGAYDQGKKAWLEQIKKTPEDLNILGNSASYFLHSDSALAKESLQTAQSLDPKSSKWPERLGHLYSLDTIRNSTSGKVDAAKMALEQFELAYSLATDSKRDSLLSDISKMAFMANNHEKASEYAHKMLSQNKPGWNHGNNIHHGNIILGKIAIASDNIEEAKKFLINAGKTPGSPQLNSFGPNMNLAKELFEKGEKSAVLEYLELCSRFWKSGQDDLNKWSTEIRSGGVPDFSSHLHR